jgi:undecaprenyl diphosphate synthase
MQASTARRSKTHPNNSKDAQASDAVPRHVAIIMDGNGRWARERGLSRQAGHRAGTENLRRLLKVFAERKVKYLTLFAFSTENWKRPKREINPLLRLIGHVIDRELQSLHENGVRLVHIGSLEPLSDDLRNRICRAIEQTKDNDRLTVCVAFNYGSRAEIVDATRRMLRDGIDPDLVIRTAGEMRLSNFLLWQSAYAEFYSTAVYWPDFDEAEVDKALLAYSQRVRNFGGLNGATANGHKSNGKHG